MRTNYLLTVSLVFFLMFQSAGAQFLKKLQKRVEEKVENAIIEKTANEAAEKATKTMDKAFDVNPFGNGGSKEKADPSLVADTYDFTWKYSIKMVTKKGDIVFDYYLKPDAPYFGFSSKTMENLFTVMDNGNKVTTMFMESQGNNFAMVSSMPDDLDLEEVKDESGGFEITSLPDKTINGYHCKGVSAVNADYEMDLYFTNETVVSFDDIYKNQQARIPSQVKDFFGSDEIFLMIYMEARNLSKKNESITMECIALEEVSKTIIKSNYKFM